MLRTHTTHQRTIGGGVIPSKRSMLPASTAPLADAGSTVSAHLLRRGMHALCIAHHFLQPLVRRDHRLCAARALLAEARRWLLPATCKLCRHEHCREAQRASMSRVHPISVDLAFTCSANPDRIDALHHMHTASSMHKPEHSSEGAPAGAASAPPSPPSLA